MSEPVSIAIVGLGGVSGMHLDGCARHPDRVRVVAGCDPDTARAEAAAAQWGIPQVFASVEAMIAGALWDVAIVCTPTPVREPIVRALAGVGKHLLVEKPLADTYGEAVWLTQMCEATGSELAVDQNFRYHYPFYQAREAIAEGRVGRVQSIRHRDLFFRQDAGWRTGQRRHALAVMGIHWLDGFRWILGEEAVTVEATVSCVPEVDCAGETDAAVLIEFPGGVTAHYVQSFSTRQPITETIIQGEKGTLVLGYGGMTFTPKDAAGPVGEPPANPYAGHGKPDSAFRCLENLLEAIRSEGEASNSGKDNLRTVALLDAAYRSAEIGGPISMEDYSG